MRLVYLHTCFAGIQQSVDPYEPEEGQHQQHSGRDNLGRPRSGQTTGLAGVETRP